MTPGTESGSAAAVGEGTTGTQEPQAPAVLQTGLDADRTALAVHMREGMQAIERWSRRTVHRGSGTTLSPNETHLLSHLASVAPQRMSALADWQGVDRSTMSLQIRNLSSRDLVTRVPDPTDRRATMIELSEAGREVLGEYVRHASRILEETLTGWSDEDLSLFDAYLARFAADLTAALEEPATASTATAQDAPTAQGA